MFEKFTSNMSRLAAQSFKDTIAESLEPVMNFAIKAAPAIGLLWASASRARSQKAVTTVINYYFNGRMIR